MRKFLKNVSIDKIRTFSCLEKAIKDYFINIDTFIGMYHVLGPNSIELSVRYEHKKGFCTILEHSGNYCEIIRQDVPVMEVCHLILEESVKMANDTSEEMEYDTFIRMTSEEDQMTFLRFFAAYYNMLEELKCKISLNMYSEYLDNLCYPDGMQSETY